jgi:DNA-binding response OmpR family regulator
MPKTILAVDYDQRTLEEIQSLLNVQDVTFLTAHDGIQAVDIFRASAPDLVLTSALLPKLNGFELCKKITGGELGQVRPVIMFSGIYKAEKYRKEAILGCGAADFLEKPLVQAHLTKVVWTLLHQPQPSKQGPTQVPETTSPRMPDVAQPPVVLDYTEPISLVSLTEDPSSSTDVLEVDDFLEVHSAESVLEIDAASEPLASEQKKTLVLDSIKNDARAPLLPPDSQDEIDAALASILIDSDHEVQMRDQRIAEEIERDIATISQNILELEQLLETPTGPMFGKNPGSNEVIDLEDKVPARGLDPPSALGFEEIPPAIPDKVEEHDEPAILAPSLPSFTLNSKTSKNWIPFAIIVLIILGTAVIFLFAHH